MPDDQGDQQAAADPSMMEAAESEQQRSQDEVMDEGAGEATEVQQAEDARAAGTDGNCAGWFSDAESISKPAAEFFVQNELTGDRGGRENRR
jgi:hypothetical protein